jgi:hypothetical protein
MSDDESDDVRAWEARQAALRPIEDQIDLMVTAFTRTLGTIKMSWPERKACYPVRFGTCLEDYFIDHGRLPTGVVEIETAREYDRPDERPGPLLVDCDAMTYTVARVLAEFPPPAAYRLSRLQRFNAFFGQILSLARLYEKTASASPEVTVAKKRDLLFEFLLSFTVHYERLPQGTLRFDRPHAPFAHFPQLGEIDFDELRRQAGIP